MTTDRGNVSLTDSFKNTSTGSIGLLNSRKKQEAVEQWHPEVESMLLPEIYVVSHNLLFSPFLSLLGFSLITYQKPFFFLSCILKYYILINKINVLF